MVRQGFAPPGSAVSTSWRLSLLFSAPSMPFGNCHFGLARQGQFDLVPLRPQGWALAGILLTYDPVMKTT